MLVPAPTAAPPSPTTSSSSSTWYDAHVENLYIQNWPAHCFHIEDTENPILSSLTLTTWVHNQDDCVAVTSGIHISMDNMYCYDGHGPSIGSIGGKSDNTVDFVTFSNSHVINRGNGCRIKSYSGTTGELYHIRYENVTISGITDCGINIQQDYLNGGPAGKPTNGVKTENVTFTHITGTMSDGKDTTFSSDGNCSNFMFENICITGASGDSCNYPTGTCLEEA